MHEAATTDVGLTKFVTAAREGEILHHKSARPASGSIIGLTRVLGYKLSFLPR